MNWFFSNNKDDISNDDIYNIDSISSESSEIENSDEESDSYSENSDEDVDSFTDFIVDTLYKTPKTQLVKIRWSPDILEYIDSWELQRSLDEKHIDFLADSFEKYQQKYNQMMISNPIHLAFKNYEENDRKKYFVMDGQHRINAYMKFNRDTNNSFPETITCIHSVDSQNEFMELFNTLNSNKPMDDDSMDLKKCEEIVKKLRDQYSDDLFRDSSCRRPRVCVEKFIQALRETTLFKQNSDHIVNKLIEFNRLMKSVPNVDRWKTMKIRCPSKSVRTKMDNLGFYFSYDCSYKYLKRLDDCIEYLSKQKIGL